MLLYELPVGILSVPGDPSNAESTASQLKQTFVFGRILLVELGSFLTFLDREMSDKAQISCCFSGLSS